MRKPGRGLVTTAAALLLAVGCTSGAPPDRAAPSDPSTTEATSSSPDTTTGTTGATGDTTPSGGDAARVTHVTDGDTIDVSLDGRDERVRLVGINAPEATQDECFSAEATAALTALVGGRTVRLVRDESDRDDYARLLRYVYVGDTFVNEDLVRRGFAQAYRYEPDTAQADRLDAAQTAAEQAQAGLWAPDACGRVRPGGAGLVVDRIEADPPGDETLDANAEFVVVRNGGAAAIDLGGWGLKDESASHRFAFPAGFTLAAGASVTVHTGCGSPTATDLFWCNQGSAVWNNDGDTAFLLDPAGNVVDTRTY